MPTSSFVESGFWCFDALFVPQQHPARDLQDTFYLSGTVSPKNTVFALIYNFIQIPNTLSRLIPTTTNAFQGFTNMVAMVHLGTGHLGQTKNLASYSYARTPPHLQPKYSTNLPPDVVVKSQRTIQGNFRMDLPQRHHQETIRKKVVSVPQSCSVSIGFSGTRLWMQLTWPSSIKSKV